jgi:hypothetical protein
MTTSLEFDGHRRWIASDGCRPGRLTEDTELYIKLERKKKLVKEECHAGRREDASTVDTVPLTVESLILQDCSQARKCPDDDKTTFCNGRGMSTLHCDILSFSAHRFSFGSRR